MSERFDEIKGYIESHTKDMVDLESLLTSSPALAPENGGDGESKKATILEEWLKSHGIKDIVHLDAKDTRVSSGVRPNLIATIPGKTRNGCLWVCAHLDVVPQGEISLWETDPWKAVEKDGKVFGRGTEDNQQGLCSGVLASLSFISLGITPFRTIKLLFMADEEVGSKYGMNFLIKNHSQIFKKEDLILIPDGGDEEGKTIEIAEKNILWLRFKTKGKQTHASRPDQGINAKLAASFLSLKIHSLEKVFCKTDPMFSPSRSTFEPTLQEKNVDGVNIIPGEDVFCADCRILPCYSLEEVRAEVKKVVSETEREYGVKIEIEELQAEESKSTSSASPVAQELSKAIKKVHGKDAKFIGIGGGTVAAGLRNAGFDAVVWSTMDELAHQPNEYCKIENIVSDALTIAFMALGE